MMVNLLVCFDVCLVSPAAGQVAVALNQPVLVNDREELTRMFQFLTHRLAYYQIEPEEPLALEMGASAPAA